jgi:hypothetical protein
MPEPIEAVPELMHATVDLLGSTLKLSRPGRSGFATNGFVTISSESLEFREVDVDRRAPNPG